MSDDIVSLVVSDNGKSHVDGQFVGMDIKTKQDNQLYTETLKQIDSKGVLYVNSLKNEDWYQQDLAHLTSNILRSETQQNSDNKTFISGRGYAGIPIQHIDGSVTYFNIMEWQARDEAIATTVDYLQGVHRDILGRDCSIDEIAPTVTKYVFRDDPRFSDYKDKTLQDLRSQVAYSDEAYNRINENVSRIRGYAWNNDAGIRHEQDRLAGGEGFNDLMKNFAYDQESYNR
ncbi:unnamed protein product, partial [Commensalibacter communis]|uniref:hypothetical protein n=1 Tax=Commensalibacter communis TaxID=2972786 RepID=UPI0022FF7E43